MEVILYKKVLIYCHLHKLKLRRGRSYIKSPEFILNKKSYKNAKNEDNKRFQYPITVALNHQNIENHRGRISNIKPLLISVIGKA